MIYNKDTGKGDLIQSGKVAEFLFEHLDQYGDSLEAIQKAIDYAFNKGGFVAVQTDNDTITGAVVVNETGMGDYIPENILVYIAVHKAHRGKGFGKILMQEVLDAAKGDIALHVEKDNPARFLYESLGFTNPYLEMRLKR